MTSTFTGIEIGKRGVNAHHQALLTAGHNIDNASTEGYSRQRVEMSAFEPIYLPGLNREETPGQIGQGVIVERIERIRDKLLDQRIIAQASSEGYWDAREKYLDDIQKLYNEPYDISVRGQMDAFWSAWEELSKHPTETAHRSAVSERGKTLMDTVHDRFDGLKRLQDQAEQDIQLTLAKVNNLSKQIAGLNGEIRKIQAQGDNPNDLLDSRDLLVDKLSSLIDITVDNRDPDEFMLHTAGYILVQGDIGRTFDVERSIETEGYSRITWNDTGDAVHFRNGYLASLVELRDVTIEGEIQSIDSMAMNFINLVNEAHRPGYGLNGRTGLDFFVERPVTANINGNFDRTGGGVYDSSYIFSITGANALEARDLVGLAGEITLSGPDGNVSVPYYPTDTVAELVQRINNSGAEVTARLDREGRLSLKADTALDPDNPDFVIRHIEDSGRFLEGYAGVLNASGAEGAYDWGAPDAVESLAVGAMNYSVAPASHPSGWIEVNPVILSDPTSVAAGYGENGRPANPGNGDAALAISAIRYDRVMVGRNATFDDYYADVVGRMGILAEQSKLRLDTEQKAMKDLTDKRQEISGVNLDEELAQMIKYQHGYAAAARFITTINTMLDTIINRMGV
ncbi:MAG: flagellar hook-associated protein FlgK [Spirochaetaceae bacterium]|jgi:flagellar hook-associated protein 1 FlgK|nr:flagellar hook-associated protein FlgK [Spirochaetaceae bacterium]